MDPTQMIERARRLKEWADGPDGLFDLLGRLEQAYMAECFKTEPAESERRTAYYYSVKALRDLRSVLSTVIANGATAQAYMTQANKIASGEIKPFH